MREGGPRFLLRSRDLGSRRAAFTGHFWFVFAFSPRRKQRMKVRYLLKYNI
jgi:hypothetical protein